MQLECASRRAAPQLTRNPTGDSEPSRGYFEVVYISGPLSPFSFGACCCWVCYWVRVRSGGHIRPGDSGTVLLAFTYAGSPFSRASLKKSEV